MLLFHYAVTVRANLLTSQMIRSLFEAFVYFYLVLNIRVTLMRTIKLFYYLYHPNKYCTMEAGNFWTRIPLYVFCSNRLQLISLSVYTGIQLCSE